MTNETKVYIADTKVFSDDSFFNKMYNTVSAERQEKIDHLQQKKDKNLSLAAEVLLKKPFWNLVYRTVKLATIQTENRMSKTAKMFSSVYPILTKGLCVQFLHFLLVATQKNPKTQILKLPNVFSAIRNMMQLFRNPHPKNNRKCFSDYGH